MNTAYTIFECKHTDKSKTSDASYPWEKLGEIIFFPENHTFIEVDQLVEYCYYVKKGRVVSYHIFPNGEERIFELHDAGELFLENSLLFAARSPVSYKTTCATELIRINKCRIKREIKENPVFALSVINQTSYKYQSSMERLKNTTTQNVHWKICDFFLVFAKKYGIPYKGKILIQEKISQQFISNYIGINRITVVRIVKELKNEGLVEKLGRFYYICDVDSLKQYQQMIDKNV